MAGNGRRKRDWKDVLVCNAIHKGNTRASLERSRLPARTDHEHSPKCEHRIGKESIAMVKRHFLVFSLVFFFLLALLPSFASVYCSHNGKAGRASSVSFGYLFLYTEMNDNRMNVCRKRKDIDGGKKRTRRTFFCLLPKCSIRLLSHIYIYMFLHDRQRAQVKKWKEKTSRIRRRHYSFSLLCVCVRLLHPRSFFLDACVCVCARARAFGVCKYINACARARKSREIERRKKRKKI